MQDVVSPLRGQFLSLAAFLASPPPWKSGVLGGLCYVGNADEARLQADPSLPCLRVPMPPLESDDALCEVWLGRGEPKSGQSGAIRYRHDETVLFGVLELPEDGFQSGAGKTPLQQATESAYRQVFSLLDSLHYPHLFRFWNYIAEINAHSAGLERYRQFNLGRQDAFLAHGRDVVGNVPAACALGSAHGPLSIAFLAGRAAPLNIENPRQISAFQYPPQYGPRSPTFSRASLVSVGQDELLFISGTASIVGHATVHPADVVAQTRETMNNVEAVLAEANRRAHPPGFHLAGLNFKVYVRHSADLPLIRAELARCLGDACEVVYLRADVCRQDLLLEIEASGHAPGASH